MWDQAQAEQVRGQAEQVRGQARGLCVCAVCACGVRSACMVRAVCGTKAHVAVGAFVVIPSRRRALVADDVFLQFVAVPDTWLGAAANPTE